VRVVSFNVAGKVEMMEMCCASCAVKGKGKGKGKGKERVSGAL